jgi:hypothetical protein
MSDREIKFKALGGNLGGAIDKIEAQAREIAELKADRIPLIIWVIEELNMDTIGKISNEDAQSLFDDYKALKE